MENSKGGLRWKEEEEAFVNIWEDGNIQDISDKRGIRNSHVYARWPESMAEAGWTPSTEQCSTKAKSFAESKPHTTCDICISEIRNSYRKLARKWHPDRHKEKKAKEEAAEIFKKIANAYEILKDDEQRKEYDYMLDNPEELYFHYYQYYKRRMAPQIDVRIVLAVTITIISVIQYWSMHNNYNSAISYLVTVPKYRLHAMQIAQDEGLLNKDKKRDRGKTKEEIRLEQENVLKEVIKEKMDIRGGYSKPAIVKILWLQLVLFPYYAVMYMVWFTRWIVLFTILRKEYGDVEKEYIMRTNMKLGQDQWETLEDHEKNSFWKQELWIKSNFKEWKKKKEEDMKIKLAESSKYRSYRRYMKKGGPLPMSFGED